MPDGDAPPIGEQECGDVDRDALAVWADFRAWNPVDAAAIVARASVERDDRGAKHGLADRRDEVSHKPGEDDGERAVQQGTGRRSTFAPPGRPIEENSDRRGDAAIVGRSARRRGEFGLDVTRFEFFETLFGGGRD